MKYGHGSEYRPGPSFAFGSGIPSGVRALLLVNVGAFLLFNLILGSGGRPGPLALDWLALSSWGVLHGRLWQLVTYMFLHGGFFHLLINMLYLFMFGSSLERVWGRRFFLRYYLITGVGAALVWTLVQHGSRVPLIAKIEKHEALDNIDEIVPLVDGLMVARGDLGVEIPIEQVPRAQKMLIEKANEAAIPVITATQMLVSMVNNPRPTRAEVTDVANAILDGTDAIMLSEETAIGKHPIAAVAVMTKVAADIEEMFPYDEWTRKYEECAKLSFEEAVAHAACAMADDIGAAAIITCTQSGSTTLNVAKYRPKQMLLAMTPDAETRRRLALVWGAISEVITSEDNALLIERNAITAALQAGHIKPGQPVVITAGIPFHVRGTTNLIKVATAEWY